MLEKVFFEGYSWTGALISAGIYGAIYATYDLVVNNSLPTLPGFIKSIKDNLTDEIIVATIYLFVEYFLNFGFTLENFNLAKTLLYIGIYSLCGLAGTFVLYNPFLKKAVIGTPLADGPAYLQNPGTPKAEIVAAEIQMENRDAGIPLAEL